MKLIFFIPILLALINLTSSSFLIVNQCHSWSCKNEESWCPPNVPGNNADNWWICCNGTWVKNNLGSSCSDIQNLVYTKTTDFDENKVLESEIQKDTKLMDIKQNKKEDYMIVDDCYGWSCTNQGDWCAPNTPGNSGTHWYICCDYTWVQNDFGGSCNDISNPLTKQKNEKNQMKSEIIEGKKSYEIVDDCYGWSCSNQGDWCAPNSPGNSGTHWYICCDNFWVQNDFGGSCDDISNPLKKVVEIKAEKNLKAEQQFIETKIKKMNKITEKKSYLIVDQCYGWSCSNIGDWCAPNTPGNSGTHWYICCDYSWVQNDFGGSCNDISNPLKKEKIEKNVKVNKNLKQIKLGKESFEIVDQCYGWDCVNSGDWCAPNTPGNSGTHWYICCDYSWVQNDFGSSCNDISNPIKKQSVEKSQMTIQNKKSYEIVDECYGWSCDNQGDWCFPNTPGNSGTHYYICCNNSWVQNDFGGSCDDISNPIIKTA